MVITLDPTEISTHESSNRPDIKSKGNFTGIRNSMNMENEEYQQLKQSLDSDIQESTTYKFESRKWSMKSPPPPMKEYVLPKRKIKE